MKLFSLKRDARDGWKVVQNRTGRAMFYGTHAECIEWLEHRGDDDSND